MPVGLMRSLSVRRGAWLSPATLVSASVQRRPQLPALTGVRIFAALHIYFFHLKQAHDAGVLRFPVLSSLPGPVANLIGRGYVSTGFFFQLSGFLAGLRLSRLIGRLKSSAWSFWKGRFLRLYPAVFPLARLARARAGALTIHGETPRRSSLPEESARASRSCRHGFQPSRSGGMRRPALSAFAAFYAVFPAFCRFTAGLGGRSLLWLVVVLAVLSWLPMVFIFWLTRREMRGRRLQSCSGASG